MIKWYQTWETAAWIGLFIFCNRRRIFISILVPGLHGLFREIIYALAALTVRKLHEPILDTKKYTLKTILTQNVSGFKEVFRNIKIAQATIVFIIIGAGYFIAANILGNFSGQRIWHGFPWSRVIVCRRLFDFRLGFPGFSQVKKFTGVKKSPYCNSLYSNR